MYEEDRNKKPIKGVTIRIKKAVSYDVAEAEEWCHTNAPTLLSLQGFLYEKAAQYLPGAPLQIDDQATVAIARDLSAYIPESE